MDSNFVGGFLPAQPDQQFGYSRRQRVQYGWVQDERGEWEWEEDDPNFVPPTAAKIVETEESSFATPKLPSGAFRPKQSLGQNYLRDPNTVAKIVRAFHADATKHREEVHSMIELGPGAGALTDPLVQKYGTDVVKCIEVDGRAVDLLQEKHPTLQIIHQDVLQVNYPQLADGEALVVVGNLPYYITSQILFALADASHAGAIHSATVTMQWEVAQRMAAPTKCKDYGILSVVFQLYSHVHFHFRIPPTVFYPQPKVDSALVGLHFLSPDELRRRLAGVLPTDLRQVVTTAFRQRRKTLRNSLKKMVIDRVGKENAKILFDAAPVPLPETVKEAQEAGDVFAQKQELCLDWASKRPEELTPGQFVELTRLLVGEAEDGSLSLGKKVWRKLKHGSNN